jgi:hemolysin activation/secretion protein
MKLKHQLMPLALLALSPSLYAQAIPGAGTQLRQITPPPPPQRSEPAIRIERASEPAAPGAASASVLVSQLRVTEARAFPERELLRITGFKPGTILSLGDLQAMAARITAHYRSHGYFVARAYLPAQDISNHIVTIAVSEGRYGKLELRNHSRLSDDIANAQLAGLDSGDAITLDPLEHRLLLLSDLPGVKVTSTLVPGSAPGTSDLLVDVAPGRRITGLVDIDNGGDPATGEWRLGGTVNFNDLVGLGDVASLRVVTAGAGLAYGRAAYQAQFGRVTAGVAYSHLDYRLGDQFDVLGANGTADVASAFASTALVRSRRSNLYLGAIYEDKRLEDRLDLFPGEGRRADARVGGLFLHGDRQDNLWGGGTSSFYLGVSSGSLDILTPAALAVDAATARTNGAYRKLWFDLARMQPVNDRLSVYASLSGQLASKNLDPSEKFVLGGLDGVRAYPQGEAFGDEGYLVDVEARLLLQGLSARLPGDVHLLGFVDAGHVRINKNPWDGSPNERDLLGAGVGLGWDEPGRFSVRTYYAFDLDNEDAFGGADGNGRFWIQAVRYF